MKLVKKTAQYSIYQRGDARYAVMDARKQPINGVEKAGILLAEDLIKATLPAKPPAAETAAADASATVESAAPAEAAVVDEVKE